MKTLEFLEAVEYLGFRGRRDYQGLQVRTLKNNIVLTVDDENMFRLNSEHQATNDVDAEKMKKLLYLAVEYAFTPIKLREIKEGEEIYELFLNESVVCSQIDLIDDEWRYMLSANPLKSRRFYNKELVETIIKESKIPFQIRTIHYTDEEAD